MENNPRLTAVINELTGQRDQLAQRCLALAVQVSDRDEQILGLVENLEAIRAAEQPLLARINDLEYANEQLREQIAGLTPVGNAAPEPTAGENELQADIAADPDPIRDHPLEPERKVGSKRKPEFRPRSFA